MKPPGTNVDYQLGHAEKPEKRLLKRLTPISESIRSQSESMRSNLEFYRQNDTAHGLALIAGPQATEQNYLSAIQEATNFVNFTRQLDAETQKKVIRFFRDAIIISHNALVQKAKQGVHIGTLFLPILLKIESLLKSANGTNEAGIIEPKKTDFKKIDTGKVDEFRHQVHMALVGQLRDPNQRQMQAQSIEQSTATAVTLFETINALAESTTPKATDLADVKNGMAKISRQYSHFNTLGSIIRNLNAYLSSDFVKPISGQNPQNTSLRVASQRQKRLSELTTIGQNPDALLNRLAQDINNDFNTNLQIPGKMNGEEGI